MVRLLHIKLRNHPFLKNLEIPLIDFEEVIKSSSPYTSVVIGNNGTGKSQILRIITEIFRILQSNIDSSDGFFPATRYGFNIAYQLNGSIYEIDSSKLTWSSRKGDVKLFECYKYPSFDYYKNFHPEIEGLQKGRDSKIEELISAEKNSNSEKDKFAIIPKEIQLPNRILASAIMLNDRFAFFESKPSDYYQYLGPRRAPNALSTKGFIKKIVRFLFDATANESFRNQLGQVLTNLGFKKSFIVRYYPIYKKQVYQKRNFSTNDLHDFFLNWREEGTIKRRKDRELWGFGHYKSIKEDVEKLESITRSINEIASKADLRTEERRAKYFDIDIFADNEKELLFNLDELIKLDLIHLENVLISNGSLDQYELQDISSGEYHILFSMLAMFSRITEDSVVLIDEPEISLHPNWQMSYVEQLKEVFAAFNSCHFVIASHSHFIVSDLEGDSSSVTSLQFLEKPLKNRRLKTELIKANTYGWSAEEVLYAVFNVRTTRNHYLEYDLRKLVMMLNSNSTEFSEMRRLLSKMDKVVLNEADPLRQIVHKAQKYLARNNA